MKRVALAALLAGALSCAVRYGIEGAPTAAGSGPADGAARSGGLELDPGAGHPGHRPGERSACTDWLFRQPWASRQDWPGVARDSAILLGLSLAAGLASRMRRR